MAKNNRIEVEDSAEIKAERAAKQASTQAAASAPEILPDEDEDDGMELQPLKPKPAAYAPDPPRATPIPPSIPQQPKTENPDHACGLPGALMDRKKLVAYVDQYGYGHKDRKRIVFTETERRYWDIYYQATGETNRVTKEFFVVALRLWKAGYAIDRDIRADINSMQVK